MEKLPTTTPEETLPEIQSIVTLSRQYLPKMQVGSEKAVARMKEITTITSEEDLEDASDLLIAVRDAYNKMYAMRTEMTSPLDQLKKKFMEYERPLNADEKTSEVTRIRGMIAAYQQKKIDDKKKIEAEAAKKKLRENHLVDIGANVLQNLADMVLNKTKISESMSASYFAGLTLENFDAKAEAYKKMKPTLKPEDYRACFAVDYNKELFTPEQYQDIIWTITKVETLDKWTEEVVRSCTPIVNAWRSKIPQLKQHLIDLKNADESERKRLAEEHAAQAQAEAQRRAAELERQNMAASLEISANADKSKLENSFVEQITTQQAGEVGPVKYVLKFTDPKLQLKAFSTIVYHVMASPKFEGIEKKKDGKVVVDANGNPEYIAGVKFWVDFFMTHCDADIQGTEVREVSKVIIRK